MNNSPVCVRFIIIIDLYAYALGNDFTVLFASSLHPSPSTSLSKPSFCDITPTLFITSTLHWLCPELSSGTNVSACLSPLLAAASPAATPHCPQTHPLTHMHTLTHTHACLHAHPCLCPSSESALKLYTTQTWTVIDPILNKSTLCCILLF